MTFITNIPETAQKSRILQIRRTINAPVLLPIKMASVHRQPVNGSSRSPQRGAENSAQTASSSLTGSNAPLSETLQNCVVIDVETTGLDPSTEKIIEVGALRVIDGEVASTFHTLINPRRPLPEVIQRITGLSDAHLQQAQDTKAALVDLLDFLHETNAVHGFSRGNPPAYFVGHHVEFDISFLEAEAQRTQSSGWEFLSPAALQCTAQAARNLIPRESVGRYRLANVAEYLKTAHKPSHRALDDSRATFEVLQGLERIQRAQRS